MDYPVQDEHLRLARDLDRRGLSFDEIVHHLRQKGIGDHFLPDLIARLKALRLARKRKSGFLYCGIGVAMLVLGCMITIFLYANGYDIKLAMYGLTIAGIIFTFKGMIDLLGW